MFRRLLSLPDGSRIDVTTFDDAYPMAAPTTARVCTTCSGTGEIIEYPADEDERMVCCPACGGTGEALTMTAQIERDARRGAAMARGRDVRQSRSQALYPWMTDGQRASALGDDGAPFVPADPRRTSPVFAGLSAPRRASVTREQIDGVMP